MSGCLSVCPSVLIRANGYKEWSDLVEILTAWQGHIEYVCRNFSARSDEIFFLDTTGGTLMRPKMTKIFFYQKSSKIVSIVFCQLIDTLGGGREMCSHNFGQNLNISLRRWMSFQKRSFWNWRNEQSRLFSVFWGLLSICAAFWSNFGGLAHFQCY